MMLALGTAAENAKPMRTLTDSPSTRTHERRGPDHSGVISTFMKRLYDRAKITESFCRARAS